MKILSSPMFSYLLSFSWKVRNYFVAAGQNSRGISNAAGIGDILSQWITNGHPPMDVTPLDIKRFMPHHNNKKYLYDRIQGTVGLLLGLPYPRKEVPFSRRVKCPVLYPTLDKAGASWGDRMGWETPNWFALTPDGEITVNFIHNEKNFLFSLMKACRRGRLVLVRVRGGWSVFGNGRDTVQTINKSCKAGSAHTVLTTYCYVHFVVNR